jgi:hypothetical protein
MVREWWHGPLTMATAADHIWSLSCAMTFTTQFNRSAAHYVTLYL